MTAYWCERALLPDGVRNAVLVATSAGRFTAVTPDQPPGTAERLSGLTIPGLANCHSHAFHRALRARESDGRGTFWTWREQMYALASRLTPDTYHALARAVYGEMVLAGITCVGEFHYLHHGHGGAPYGDPNAMGKALVAAARDAGLRITLLDTCYLAGGIGEPLDGVQLRFADRDAERWAERVDALAGAADVVIGAAAHSVRAVPRDQLGTVAAAFPQAPLHVHLSERIAENEACEAAYGRTPAQVLGEAGCLGDRATAVHATHLSGTDIELLGGHRVSACLCPTTERHLADGIGPSAALRDAGSRLTLGTDSHAVIDLFEEMRAVELNERVVSGRRGVWSAAELLAAVTIDGHGSLGFPDAGRIAPGARADLVTVRLDSVRTAGAGAGPQTAVFAATAADVTSVVASGRRIVADGNHLHLDVPAVLARAVAALG